MVTSSPTNRLLTLVGERRLLRTRDLDEEGIPRVYLTRLVRAGKVRRIGRGLYELTDASVDERATLAEVCARVPRGVICLLSAVAFHGRTTQVPHAVWVAVATGAISPKLDFVNLEVVRMDPGTLTTEGVERHDYYGADIRVTSLEKTVADLVKYRSRVGLEVALEALKDYTRTAKSYDTLLQQARLNRVETVLTTYLQGMLA